MAPEYALYCGSNDGISRATAPIPVTSRHVAPAGGAGARIWKPSALSMQKTAVWDLPTIGNKGPDDWAADTGPTAVNEGSGGAVTTDFGDRSSTLSDHVVNQPPYEDRVAEMPLRREPAKAGGGDRTRKRRQKPQQRG